MSEVQNQMLPPALPLSAKSRVKKADPMKKSETSAKIEEEKAETSSQPLSKSEVSDTTHKEKEFAKGDGEKSKTTSHKLPNNDGKEDAEKKEGMILKQEEMESKMLPPTLPSDKNNKTEQTEQIKNDKDKDDYPELPYTEPSWAGVPQEPYSLELLKGGCIISTKHLTSKSYYLFGRLPNCDIVMEHPSISRYHAILQYKASDSTGGKKGFYLYDLRSTHGTKVNKIAMQPKRYYRLQVGYVIKFGGSSRLYVLQGPEEMEQDDLPEEMQEAIKSSSEVGKVMSEAEYEEWKEEKEKIPEETTESGCSWGFGEDAEEEDVVNPFASELEEGMEAQFEFKDPKKTLRGYFEREGLDLEYQVEETGPGHARVYHCRIKLPVEDANGDPLYAEATVTGKKRESVLACAAEACRILDMNGLLRQSSHESKKQKLKNWEDNDYYDSDEDTFLDRTGSIEKKRLKRMKMAKKENEETETFESLSSKLKAVEEEIQSLEDKLETAVKASKAAEQSEDSLEYYMKNIGNSMDRTSRIQMKRRIFDLKKEKQKLARLVKISMPASLPTLVNTQPPKSLSKEIDGNRTEDSNTTTTVASTSDSSNIGAVTADPATDTRHEKAEVKDKVAQKSKDTPPDHDGHSDENKNKEKTETFAKPKVPFLQPKPKQAPPSSSISMLLQGLKSSADQGTEKRTKKEKRPRKHSGDHHETCQEPVQKKKASYPQLSPHSPPQSPPSPPQSPPSPPKMTATEDDNYSEWVPPVDQTGDGRTKLNEKYGY